MNAPGAGYIVIDASIWVSRLVPQDVFHARVSTWMETQRRNGRLFLSPAVLLPEVAGAISRRSRDASLARRSVAMLRNLPALRLVEMDQPLVFEAASLAADLGLRGADSLYVATAVRLKLPLATLDRDQMEKAATVVAVHNFEG
jgi:predicted nucleic acid-binding protein